MTDDLVTASWLAAHLDSPDLVILDCSWHLPTAKRDAKAEYRAGHIPGARFFDIDEISDTDNPLPHMLPSPEKFASRVRKLGIGDGKRVVVYDTLGMFSAARVWWMFKVFGHDDVAVLDGGLPKWQAEGHAIEEGPPLPPQERHFTARYRSLLVQDKAGVAEAIKSGRAQVVDARSSPRFRGEQPEPRPNVRSGHIPGSYNVPYGSLLAPDGTFKSGADIAGIFAKAGVDPARAVITSCGSGVSSAVLNLGLALAGSQNHALYDGSWAEWGSDPDMPVATGA